MEMALRLSKQEVIDRYGSIIVENGVRGRYDQFYSFYAVFNDIVFSARSDEKMDNPTVKSLLESSARIAISKVAGGYIYIQE